MSILVESLELCLVSNYLASMANWFHSLPKVTPVAINGGGELDPGFLVIDGRWLVRSAHPACPIKRITCRVNPREEDITKGSV